MAPSILDPRTSLVAVLVALAEVGGGLAVLVGGLVRRDWLTRLGGGVTIPVLIGAIAMVHWGQWSFVPSPSQSGLSLKTALGCDRLRWSPRRRA
ncbi:hypothetical protein [Thiocapsa sp.]|uniref:hypothetical protein n=1 Tax=Thiocapsa sp. TaxID=2024551 RepID=UPI0025FD2011|nr:hypothetical protein [Thiocapsa sp.]